MELIKGTEGSFIMTLIAPYRSLFEIDIDNIRNIKSNVYMSILGVDCSFRN